MTTYHSENELLTVEQFASRLQVSRTTVFEWLKSGVVEEGKHFFRIGRIVRFVWDTSLFLGKPVGKRPARKRVVSRPKDQRRLRVPSQASVNLDY